MNHWTCFFFLLFLYSSSMDGQTDASDKDAFFLKQIYSKALTDAQCYDWLGHLSNEIGGRLSGSPQAAAAVEYTRQMLDSLQLDSVWLQACTVPHWVRGKAEVVRIVGSARIGSLDLPALSLGNSPGTGPNGLTAEVIEVQSLNELDQLGRQSIEGKVVFFNRPLDPTQYRTFNAYGGAVDQRVYGPARAARLGAVAALVRSMTTRQDDIPHTGVTVFKADETPIPAIAISTNASNRLSRLIKQEKVRVYVENHCKTLAPKTSYNVIGEIRGSEYPEEILLVGGHLDSWDVGGGAHDDGAGCVQSMEVLRLIKQLNYRPKRTIRCVLFMNEENGLAGGLKYAEVSNQHKEFHLAAIESDAGGFSPRSFSTDGKKETYQTRVKKMTKWLPLLEPYGINFTRSGSGADISPLKSQGGLLIGLRPDSQRYFDYHHTAIDNFDAVNKRELVLGAAAMTSLIYLIDQYGL